MKKTPVSKFKKQLESLTLGQSMVILDNNPNMTWIVVDYTDEPGNEWLYIQPSSEYFYPQTTQWVMPQEIGIW